MSTGLLSPKRLKYSPRSLALSTNETSEGSRIAREGRSFARLSPLTETTTTTTRQRSHRAWRARKSTERGVGARAVRQRCARGQEKEGEGGGGDVALPFRGLPSRSPALCRPSAKGGAVAACVARAPLARMSPPPHMRKRARYYCAAEEGGYRTRKSKK